ncbi:hypothetical protein ES705_43201 [subsurface metagenome]
MSKENRQKMSKRNKGEKNPSKRPEIKEKKIIKKKHKAGVRKE